MSVVSKTYGVLKWCCPFSTPLAGAQGVCSVLCAWAAGPLSQKGKQFSLWLSALTTTVSVLSSEIFIQEPCHRLFTHNIAGEIIADSFFHSFITSVLFLVLKYFYLLIDHFKTCVHALSADILTAAIWSQTELLRLMEHRINLKISNRELVRFLRWEVCVH